MIQLRDYQQEGVNRIGDAYRSGHRRVLFVLPTGGGKTITFCYLAQRAAGAGKRVLIMAHRDPICEQISAELTNFGIQHGYIVAGRSMRDLPVQVGMMGTVARRLKKLTPPDFIIVDEAHRAAGRTYMNILSTFSSARSLLVTATPQRTDGRGLKCAADVLIQGPTVRWLMDNGYLSDYRLFCPPSLVNLDGIKETGGDYNQAEMQKRVDRPEIIGDALAHYQRIANGKKFVAFCAGTKNAVNVAQKFSAAGIPTKSIDGTMHKTDRDAILAGLRSGEILGVTSCDLISEGFDLPAIEVAILLRPTQSIIVYLQQVGRALRRCPGKQHAIILDHVGNSMRYYPDGSVGVKHGLPDADREWSLEDREKKKKKEEKRTLEIKVCSKCYMNYVATLSRCPHCSTESRTFNLRMIEETEGELAEATADQDLLSRLRGMSYPQLVKEISSVEDIKRIREAKGYKSAWAIRTAAEKFAVSEPEAARMLGYDPRAAYMGRKSYYGRVAEAG